MLRLPLALRLPGLGGSRWRFLRLALAGRPLRRIAPSDIEQARSARIEPLHDDDPLQRCARGMGAKGGNQRRAEQCTDFRKHSFLPFLLVVVGNQPTLSGKVPKAEEKLGD
jgi:hypothetical protein